MSPRSSAIVLLAIAVLGVAAVFFTYGLLFPTRVIRNGGTVNAVGVGVYGESACTNEVKEINWGALEPGSTRTITVYVRNEGTVPMTLNMTTSFWSPSIASDYITLVWNREGNVVSVQSVLQTDLTLSVSPSVSGISSFSFNVTIAGFE